MALRRRLQITIYSEIIPLLHEGEEGQFQVYWTSDPDGGWTGRERDATRHP